MFGFWCKLCSKLLNISDFNVSPAVSSTLFFLFSRLRQPWPLCPLQVKYWLMLALPFQTDLLPLANKISYSWTNSVTLFVIQAFILPICSLLTQVTNACIIVAVAHLKQKYKADESSRIVSYATISKKSGLAWALWSFLLSVKWKLNDVYAKWNSVPFPTCIRLLKHDSTKPFPPNPCCFQNDLFQPRLPK